MTGTTDLIPFDATANMADELGISVPVSGVSLNVLSPATSLLAPGVDYTQKLFPGNRVKFQNQLSSSKVYTITSVVLNGVDTQVTLDSALQLTAGSPTANLAVNRYYGGRGDATSSRIACSSTYCPNIAPSTGSMQAKLNALSELLTLGVNVDRDEPDAYNGMTWRITFLDDSGVGPLNFNLQVAFDYFIGQTLSTVQHRVDNLSIRSSRH